MLQRNYHKRTSKNALLNDKFGRAFFRLSCLSAEPSYKWFANESESCLLLVHHTCKQQADDKFDMISGTNGLMKTVDGAFFSEKKSGGR